jgi:hypothetical protein
MQSWQKAWLHGKLAGSFMTSLLNGLEVHVNRLCVTHSRHSCSIDCSYQMTQRISFRILCNCSMRPLISGIAEELLPTGVACAGSISIPQLKMKRTPA